MAQHAGHIAAQIRVGTRQLSIFLTRHCCSIAELIEQLRSHIGKVPVSDLNLEHLKAALQRGWEVKEIQLEPFGGPLTGYLGVRFLLERNGLQVVIPVSPGEGLAQFLKERAAEWEQVGIHVHYITR